jgi:hypothetical protein
MISGGMSQVKTDSDLPPISSDHGFEIGDRVSMPIYGRDDIRGTIQYVDYWAHKKHIKGLVVIGDDKRYYEFHPELATKIR